MYVCIPARPGAVRHAQRIVEIELQLLRCTAAQSYDAQKVVAELAEPLCRCGDVGGIGLSIQRSADEEGAISIRVGPQGATPPARRDISLPRPRPPLDDRPEAVQEGIREPMAAQGGSRKPPAAATTRRTPPGVTHGAHSERSAGEGWPNRSEHG